MPISKEGWSPAVDREAKREQIRKRKTGIQRREDLASHILILLFATALGSAVILLIVYIWTIIARLAS